MQENQVYRGLQDPLDLRVPEEYRVSLVPEGSLVYLGLREVREKLEFLVLEDAAEQTDKRANQETQEDRASLELRAREDPRARTAETGTDPRDQRESRETRVFLVTPV